MIKRVVLVLTLLFAQTVSGQDANLEQGSSGSAQAEQPVVTIQSAIGETTLPTVEIVTPTVVTVVSTSSPAEKIATTTEISPAIEVPAENGAFGTSSTSTLVSATGTVNVASTTPISEEENDGGIFDIVYGGFEEFVEKFFGWE